MLLMKCASEVRKATQNGRRGDKRRAMNLEQRADKGARCNLPKLPNTTFMVVICRVQNSNNDKTPSMQLQALYTDVGHWEELIDFIEQNCGPKEPYCLTTIYKCNLTQGKLDEEYMGLYALGQMMNDPLYGRIS